MTTKSSTKVITFDSLDELMEANIPQEVKEAIAKLIDEDTSEVTLDSLDVEYKKELDKAKEAKLAEATKLYEMAHTGEISSEEATKKGFELLFNTIKEASKISKKYQDKAKELGLIPEEKGKVTDSCSCNNCKEMDAEDIKEENAKVTYAEEIVEDALKFLKQTQDMDVNALSTKYKEAFKSAATLTVFALLELGKIK